MQALEFVRLVAEMRSAQKDYFAQRTRSALNKSLALEKQVDRAVLQFLGNAVTAEQESLFEHRAAPGYGNSR